jgi:predicted RNA binding protein YcfA (HicA-like mRNA interferase family)
VSRRLPALTARDIIQVARRLGFVLDRQKGSHAVFVRAADGARIVVPIHKGRVLKRKTLRAIVEDMGIEPDAFLNLLS